MFECFDIEKTNENFYQNIYGIRVIIQNEKQKKTLVINGIIEDVDIDCFSNIYIDERIKELNQIVESYQDNEKSILLRIIDTLSLKDILIHGNNDIQKKIISVITEVTAVKQSKIDLTVKKFLELAPYYQRDMLINLLLCNNDDEILYVCYLLYDLITANSVDNNEKNEQKYIYNSLPWKIKEYFKDVVKYTIKYTNDLIQKYDVNKITLEQQIYLLKANDNIKEKAMAKLKEVKGNSNENGMKAKQYLEGLIKIPFGLYKEEPILKKIKNINATFIKINPLVNYFFPNIQLSKKDKYTVVEILEFCRNLETYIKKNIQKTIEINLEKLPIRELMNIVQYVNIIKRNNKQHKIPTTNQSKSLIINKLINFINDNQKTMFSNIIEIFDKTNPKYKFSLSKTISEIKDRKSVVRERVYA
jgi:hypothetical protein